MAPRTKFFAFGCSWPLVPTSFSVATSVTSSIGSAAAERHRQGSHHRADREIAPGRRGPVQYVSALQSILRQVEFQPKAFQLCSQLYVKRLMSSRNISWRPFMGIPHFLLPISWTKRTTTPENGSRKLVGERVWARARAKRQPRRSGTNSPLFFLFPLNSRLFFPVPSEATRRKLTQPTFHLSGPTIFGKSGPKSDSSESLLLYFIV